VFCSQSVDIVDFVDEVDKKPIPIRVGSALSTRSTTSRSENVEPDLDWLKQSGHFADGMPFEEVGDASDGHGKTANENDLLAGP